MRGCPFVSKPYTFAIKRDIHHFWWMFSFYIKFHKKDSNPERGLSVKQNSPVDCFVAKRCEDGYRMRQHWVVKQCKKSPIYCVLLPLPRRRGLHRSATIFYLKMSPDLTVAPPLPKKPCFSGSSYNKTTRLNTRFKRVFAFISASVCGQIIVHSQHQTGINLLYGSFCLQRFRLLQHQNSIR